MPHATNPPATGAGPAGEPRPSLWAGLKARFLAWLAAGQEEEGGEGYSPVSRLFVWLCAVLVAAFLLWAAVFRLDIVSAAAGQVAPSSQVKSVQHLEGGIVREINVRDGDTVKEGQPLVVLEQTAQGSSVEELEVRINGLTAETSRLEAEAEGRPAPAFPEDLVRRNPDLVQQSLDLFKARRQRLDTENSAQRENIVQAEQEIREIQARLGSTRRALGHTREQIKISEQLLEEGLTPRTKHLALLREETGFVGKIEQDMAALPKAESALVEAREKLKKIEQQFREEAREDLNKKRRDLEEFTQRLRKFADTLTRTVIRSPVDGVVKKVHVATVGGVVKPGDSVAEIVPSEDRLIIEAHLPIGDIGYVQAGQDAKVTMATSDAGRYGRIHGKVVHVSPDAFADARGRTFYAVRIETSEDSFKRGSFRYRLTPGMQVIAYIHTGERTVLEYLLDPFLATMDVALTER
ncbi:MAG: HlyD family type I secretion periplasmic adaptor subunit [Thermodesulfobacteriota bacterium]